MEIFIYGICIIIYKVLHYRSASLVFRSWLRRFSLSLIIWGFCHFTLKFSSHLGSVIPLLFYFLLVLFVNFFSGMLMIMIMTLLSLLMIHTARKEYAFIQRIIRHNYLNLISLIKFERKFSYLNLKTHVPDLNSH